MQEAGEKGLGGGRNLELSELAAYVREKYHMQEQHKWADFPGFSVLTHPHTGKWVALLMRHWDGDSGEEIQRCDLKCGQQVLYEQPQPFLSKPFRMKGPKWVGITFEDGTNPQVVFQLFDRAISSEDREGCTIVLQHAPVQQTVVYPSEPLPPVQKSFPALGVRVPEKIQEMLRLYEHGDESFREKCFNFWKQGKFMEDYEDNEPWTGDYKRYFPTYHDLNVRQLRGYFTWRTQVRKGKYTPIAASFAYLYVYELLNGIGASSPEDSLEKLRNFKEKFVDSGIGDPAMEGNLRNWMLEFAVVQGVSPELARQYMEPELLRQDDALEKLAHPEEAGDQELFSAICTFEGKKLGESPVLQKEESGGKHLFAQVWRTAWKRYHENGKNLFIVCFGEKQFLSWYPLGNAVYWEEQPHPDGVYVLDPCRTYRCQQGSWQVEEYNKLYYNKNKFQALFHEADRQLRKYLKTGRYLREKPEEAWAAPFVEAVLEQDQRERLEAAKPKIVIDLSNLDQIRRDAVLTRDSLLTEEERQEIPDDKPEPPVPQEISPVVSQETHSEGTDVPGLDQIHSQILWALLQRESPEPILRSHHLMASVVADTINEAFLDRMGDTVLEFDGSTLAVVEDYREDILDMLEDRSDE